MAAASPCLPPPLARSWVPPAWDEATQGSMRAVVSSACKRLPNNAQAHFHLGLLHMRNADGENAVRAFTTARTILDERVRRCSDASLPVPPRLTKLLASLRAHTAQAAHLAASSKLSREERAPLLDRLQADLVASTAEDHAQPNVWNALALLHLGEGGFHGARDVLRSICETFPDYLDAQNNLGLAELALGDERAAVACFQNVVLRDMRHSEALSNYALVLLRRGVYPAAARLFRAATEGTEPGAFGLSFAWGGLAIAEAAMGHMGEAENAAGEAEATADSESKTRFSMLRACIRARRVTDALRRGVLSFDGRDSVFVRAPPTPKRGRPANNAMPSFRGEEDTEKDYQFPNLASGSLCPSRHNEPSIQEGTPRASGDSFDHEKVIDDPRLAIEGTVTVMRSVSRDIRSASASSSLGAFLRLRHEYSWEESGNRNYGAESAERLVDALESDPSDACSWVQLALLQLGAGEYESSRDFCMQSVSRARTQESAWNALGVSFQLNNQVPEAVRAFEKAALAAVENGDQERNASHLRGQPAALQNIASDQGTLSSRLQNKSFEPNASSGGSVYRSRGASNVANDFLKCHETAPEGDLGLVSNDEALSLSLISEVGTEGGVHNMDLNRSCLAALAAIYNNLGNAKRHEGGSKAFAEAQSAFEKSLRLGGESPAVYNNLALLYVSMGRLEDAEKMLSHALSIAPHFDCSASNLIKLRRLKASRESPS